MGFNPLLKAAIWFYACRDGDLQAINGMYAVDAILEHRAEAESKVVASLGIREFLARQIKNYPPQILDDLRYSGSSACIGYISGRSRIVTELSFNSRGEISAQHFDIPTRWTPTV